MLKKQWSIKQDNLLYPQQSISTFHDYLNSLKNQNILQSVFQLTNDDFIVNNLEQHTKRWKKDYSVLLLRDRPEEVFKERYKNHQKLLKKQSNKNV